MKLLLGPMLAAALLITGCASNPMQLTQQPMLSSPAEDATQVVIMRDSLLGAAIAASVYDVTDGEPEFLGILANGTKLVQQTTPGKHVYMVVSEAADFMEADLQGGKTYYSLVTPRMGFWKARFSMWPMKADPTAEHSTKGKNFGDLVDNTKTALLTDKARAWYSKNQSSVKSKQADYWPVWQKKSPEDLKKRTLEPQDGI